MVIRALLNSCGDIFNLWRTISIVFVLSGVNKDVNVTIGLTVAAAAVVVVAVAAVLPAGALTTGAGFSN